MQTVNPYLNFPGTAEEAFNFYKSIFGGEFSIVQRFREIPDAEKIPEADRDKIMHIALPLGKGHALMASDYVESMGHPLTVGNNLYLTIEAENKEEADRLFHALSAGGKVEIPMQETFWEAYYGMFEDRYGTHWMINYSHKQT